MDLFDFLQSKPEKNINTSSESYIAIGEAEDEFGIPDGIDDAPTDFGDDSVNGGGEFGGDDFSMDDGFGDDGGENGEEIFNPLEDIEDSELSLVSQLRENFSTLYKECKTKFGKLMSRNLSSSDFGPEFKEAQEQYKEVLSNMYSYLKNKYDKESLATKIIQFNTFKIQINTIHETLNDLMEKIGVKGEEELF